MIASDDEVFFVESSASDDEREDSLTRTEGDKVNKDQQLPSLGAPHASSGYFFAPHNTFPTMEDVLFDLAPPKRRPAPPPQQQQQQQQGSLPITAQSNAATEAPCSTPLSGSSDRTNGSTRHGETPVHGSADAKVPFPYAGGSAVAMPVPRTTPPPRSLSELRSMTSSEVREELERFFVHKDTHSKHFKGAEAELLASESRKTESPASPSQKKFNASKEELLAQDRCRRLVNVSNWDNAINGYSQWDVLLPAGLLPEQAAAAALSSSAASSHRRTLRPHQVEGIRFLWSVLAEGPVGQVPAVGCILAHTMGLGKTGQVVIFLHLFMAAFVRRREPARMSSSTQVDAAVEGSAYTATAFSHTPSPATAAKPLLPRVLIVIPKSTQSGWQREFRTWSMSFPESYRLHPLFLEEKMRPNQRVDLFRQWRRQGGVLLVGYEALVRLTQLVEGDSVMNSAHPSQRGGYSDPGYPGTQSDSHRDPSAQLTAREQRRRDMQARRQDEGGRAYGGDADPFTELVICDEAHRLKSVHLQVVQALRGLHPLRRMLLTGTPLQNHLHEYWAMMDFCIHKYFSRKRFREYFIQPIESSANTRATEREVDLARKKTFTLINEVRHFVQRVDSTPLRTELPPLHEYILVLPPSQLQKELYLRFIQIVQHDGSQRLQFLQAVSYSGKIAAHPQLVFQMRDRLFGNSASTKGRGNGARGMASGPRHGDVDYWNLAEKRRRETETATTAGSTNHKNGKVDSPPSRGRRRDVFGKGHTSDVSSSENAEERKSSTDGSSDGDDDADAVVITDTDSGSSSNSDGGREEQKQEAKAEEAEEEFARVAQQSFSRLYPAPLTYEELCIPPSPTYVPRLEEGAKLYVAMKLIAAAMRQGEKVLLFSLSTQLLSFFEEMVAKASAEWCVPQPVRGRAASATPPPLLPRPIRYCRLDGSHTADQRATMLDQFDRADGPDLFLLSMKAGGVGITITAATRVILVDTSFNPADDQQAIGRAYRYGQAKPVYVYRLMCYPTLEYSIFVQKLAKEWLFKTVVEESSVKRDGLAGMHLQELFSILTRAARTLEKPPAATRLQMQSTESVLHDDPMLAVAQPNLLYAQRYEVFLERDGDDQYGEAEEEYYKNYCRSRLFDTPGDDDAEQRRAADMQARRMERMDEAAQLQAQSKTLTKMVDDLITSRAGTDPHLAHLLTVMGLHVDPTSGRVQTTSSTRNERATPRPVAAGRPQSLQPSNEQFAPSPVMLVGGNGAAAGMSNHTMWQQLPLQPPPPPQSSSDTHNTPQTAVMLLDSDEDSTPVPPVVNPPTAPTAPTPPALPSDVADQIGASLAQQPYVRYRPGGSPSRAVDVDSDPSH